MEAELRAIVAKAVGTDSRREIGLAEAIRRRFAPVGGVDDLVLPLDMPPGEPPSFATRDTEGFEGCGLTVINPWEARSA